MVLESTCTTLKTLYTRLKIFLKPIYQRILRILREGVTLLLRQNPFRIYFPFTVFFKIGNPSETKIPDLYKAI